MGNNILLLQGGGSTRGTEGNSGIGVMFNKLKGGISGLFGGGDGSSAVGAEGSTGATNNVTASGVVGAAGSAMNMANTAFGDPGTVTEEPGSGFMTGASGALSGAASGAALGPIGAIAGGALGLTTSLIGRGKEKKAYEKYLEEQKLQGMRDANASGAQSLGSLYAKNGGTFRVPRADSNTLQKVSNGKRPMFKRGGKMNVIPGGVLHSRKNALGSKGLPVVDENGEKQLEIEKEELILSSDAASKLEKLYYNLPEEPGDANFLAIGKFMSDQIVNNTVDKSGKYEDINKG